MSLLAQRRTPQYGTRGRSGVTPLTRFARSALVACALFAAVHAPARADSSAAAARAQLEAQIAAWNRGDLEGALSTYLDDPAMTWVGASGVARGFEAFAADMRAQFGKQPEAMGRYTAEVLEERSLAPDQALLVFRWRIDRDGKRLFGGVSTQLWQRRGARWFCVLEHAS